MLKVYPQPKFLDEGIEYSDDDAGLYDYAHFDDSILSLARRVDDGAMFLVADAFGPREKWIPIRDARYTHAATHIEFKLIAWVFKTGEEVA